jgi:hypothetical protein
MAASCRNGSGGWAGATQPAGTAWVHSCRRAKTAGVRGARAARVLAPAPPTDPAHGPCGRADVAEALRAAGGRAPLRAPGALPRPLSGPPQVQRGWDIVPGHASHVGLVLAFSTTGNAPKNKKVIPPETPPAIGAQAGNDCEGAPGISPCIGTSCAYAVAIVNTAMITRKQV